MFNPSKDDVRRFFCDAWAKHRQGTVLSPLEAIAVDWIARHPEYQDELADGDAAVARDYRIEDGRTNPFLHLSMHLAIAEQVAADEPPGIRAAYQALLARGKDEHGAAHAMMDCLGEVVWAAQRGGTPLPPEEMTARYLDCLARKASAD